MKLTNEQLKTAVVGTAGTSRNKNGVLTRHAPALYIPAVTGYVTAADQWTGLQRDFTTLDEAIVAAVEIAKARGLPITKLTATNYPTALKAVKQAAAAAAKRALDRAAEKATAAEDAAASAINDAQRALKTLKVEG